jgi:NAD(P)-dependent dehydrogenase (short-subunit alcohol dehydrogenase family)
MKTAFITGAARGLGREVAIALGRDGHALYLADILGDELERTAAELREAGHKVTTRVLDVRRRAECFAAVEDCVAQAGALDVLVNVAGILRMEHFTEMPEEGWNQILAVNLSGPVFLCQAAIPHLIAAKGNIVNVTSATGLFGAAYASAYAATKAAMNSITRTLAMEYTDQPIRINAVCPGAMTTPMTAAPVMPENANLEVLTRYRGLRGQMHPAELAAVVAFLASDAASAVHGALWAADGGMSAG